MPPSNTKITAHQSDIRSGEPGTPALVCFHGIVGSPRQFRPWTSALPENIPYYNFLLPGHGGSQSDFIHSSMSEWQAFVDEKLDELHQRHKELVIMTHSMGGLLTLDYYRRSQNRAKKIILLAMPLFIHLRPFVFRQSLSALRKSQSDEAELRAAKESYSIQSGPLYAYLGWLPHHLALLRKIRSVRKSIAADPPQALLILGGEDELVSLKSGRFVEKQGLPCLVLPGCTHVYYPEEAQKEIFRLLREALEF